MQIDDRLATVLRSRIGSAQAARAQFRQLIDLLGSAPEGPQEPLVEQAYARLTDIEQALSPIERAYIIREAGLRLRSPWLLSHLAEGDAQPAAAALATARLAEDEWLALIPELTVTARGFLRHRRDLPGSVTALLARLGVGDLVLPKPEDPPAGHSKHEATAVDSSISALARRIEAFRQSRQSMRAQLTPSEPGGNLASMRHDDNASICDFSIDAEGRIDWAGSGFGSLLHGLLLATEERVDPQTLSALRHHQPILGGQAVLEGVARIAGEWSLDAAPRFTRSGAFAGHFGRLRRPVTGKTAPAWRNGKGDRIRQALHEIRTPLGAIQGFAEIIQHQMLGSVPNAYRALAGGIGVDTARVLAGLEEIERLVKLEEGQLEPSGEPVNLKLIVEQTLQRLEGVLRPQSAKMRLLLSGDNFNVGLGEEDAALLVWRVLATLAGALAPGEVIELALRSDGQRIAFGAELPLALTLADNPFAATPPVKEAVVAAGMFGTGFTLRLARAEAEAFGGSLRAEEELLVVDLPALSGD
jgi:two-component system OmpR family sensor kinase